MIRMVLIAILAIGSLAAATGLPEPLLREEARRHEIAQRVSAPTIAIFEATATNGGSGVIVSPDGYAVTNYHVVGPCGPGMTCALSDGRLVEAVLVGLDPTGDIALVKLLGEGPFPAATIGDSDSIRTGDEAWVVGNPFLLAEDFTPTLTRGIISGVHRYQYPSGTILEYADCLQTDAAINPGNSGGPLFDGQGRLIGINGRGSFEKRGRVNVGIGYAVSINQVMRFLPQLKCGRVVDHAALGATVITRRGSLSIGGSRAIINAIDTLSDAYRRGLRPGDELVSIGGRDVASANDVLNAVGRSPAGWREAIEYRRDGRLFRTDVRLAALHGPGELLEAIQDPRPKAAPPKGTPTGWRPHYEQREGYANHHFTRLETARLLSLLPAAWIDGQLLDDVSGDPALIEFDGRGARWKSNRGRYRFDAGRDPAAQRSPPAAPGLLAGLWVWRSLVEDASLIDGSEGLGQSVDRLEAFGRTPWEAGQEPADVLLAALGGMTVEFYFDAEASHLIGIEVTLDESTDPTRIAVARVGDSPRATVRVGDRVFAELWRLSETPTSAGESQ